MQRPHSAAALTLAPELGQPRQAAFHPDFTFSAVSRGVAQPSVLLLSLSGDELSPSFHVRGRTAPSPPCEAPPLRPACVWATTLRIQRPEA